MSYKEEVYLKASKILAQRKRDAQLNADKKYQKFIQGYPKAFEIERYLQSTSSQIARAVLSGANVRVELEKLRDINLAKQKEFQEILTLANLTQEDITPQYTCANCSDTGYKNGYICDCHRNLLKQISFDELNSLTHLENSSFENYNLSYLEKFTPAQKNLMLKTYNFCREYASKFSKNSDSLLFCGATGLGKTHLSLSIAKVAISKGFTVVYGSVQSFTLLIEKERFTNNLESINSLNTCDLLILDDLGTEFNSNYTQSIIYDIINTRIMKNNPTIISTNLDSKELQQRYGERMISRFFGAYRVLQFVGKDLRAVKKLEDKI